MMTTAGSQRPHAFMRNALSGAWESVVCDSEEPVSRSKLQAFLGVSKSDCRAGWGGHHWGTPCGVRPGAAGGVCVHKGECVHVCVTLCGQVCMCVHMCAGRQVCINVCAGGECLYVRAGG